MTHGAHARHRDGPAGPGQGSRRTAVVLAAFGVLALVAGIVAWTTTLLPDTTDARANSPTVDDTPTVKAAASAPNKTAEGEPIPESLVECQESLALADKVVRAARPGVDHWEAHLRAHTELVEGKIDYSDAEAIFDETSADGPEDLKRFDAADAKYKKVEDACEAIANGVPEKWEVVAQTCLFYDGAARSAVEESRGVMKDWRAHLSDERANREGELTGDEAQAKWIEAWRNGSPKIAAFASALEQRDSTPQCDTSTP